MLQQVALAMHTMRTTGRTFSSTALFAALYHYDYGLVPGVWSPQLLAAVAGCYTGSAAADKDAVDGCVAARCATKRADAEGGRASDAHVRHLRALLDLVAAGKFSLADVCVRVTELHVTVPPGALWCGAVGFVRFLEGHALAAGWQSARLLNKSCFTFSPTQRLH